MNILIEDKVTIEDTVFYITAVQLHKSYLLLISDQEDLGIGSVTLGSPPFSQDSKSASTSFALFGISNSLISKVISERASLLFKAPVLLLLFLKSKPKEEDLIKPLGNYLSKIISEKLET